MNRWVARIKQYAIPFSEKYDISVWKLVIGYGLNYILYRCSIRDYFTLEWPFLNYRGKRNFITATECKRFYKRENDVEQAAILDNKEKFLNYFSNYVGRVWCGQEYNNSELNYREFEDKWNKCILKPLNEAGGHGIKFVEDIKKLQGGSLYNYCKAHNLLAEEIIVQHSKMAALHKNSVNTIRIFTYKTKAVMAVVRMGVGNSNLDNASSGGIFAPIDMSTGIVKDGAYSFEISQILWQHPTSGVILLGYQIPLWKECIQLVEEASKLIPGIPLCGWDVAIVESGPLLIEANAEPEIPLIQIPAKHGIRNLIDL